MLLNIFLLILEGKGGQLSKALGHIGLEECFSTLVLLTGSRWPVPFAPYLLEVLGISIPRGKNLTTQKS